MHQKRGGGYDDPGQDAGHHHQRLGILITPGGEYDYPRHCALYAITTATRILSRRLRARNQTTFRRTSFPSFGKVADEQMAAVNLVQADFHGG